MSTTHRSGTTPSLVRPITSLQAKEDRRRLAVQRVCEGETQAEVARSLKVSTRAVAYWMEWYRDQGEDGLKLRPIPGPESKLSATQERSVLDWLSQDATAFGFRTNLWTSRRITQVIAERLGIHYNANYFCAWLKQRGITPQKPLTRDPRRDEAAIEAFPQDVFEPLLKKVGVTAPISF